MTHWLAALAGSWAGFFVGLAMMSLDTQNPREREVQRDLLFMMCVPTVATAGYFLLLWVL